MLRMLATVTTAAWDNSSVSTTALDVLGYNDVDTYGIRFPSDRLLSLPIDDDFPVDLLLIILKRSSFERLDSKDVGGSSA